MPSFKVDRQRCIYFVVKEYSLKLKHTLKLAHHFVSHSTPRNITIVFFSEPKRMVLQASYKNYNVKIIQVYSRNVANLKYIVFCEQSINWSGPTKRHSHFLHPLSSVSSQILWTSKKSLSLSFSSSYCCVFAESLMKSTTNYFSVNINRIMDYVRERIKVWWNLGSSSM